MARALGHGTTQIVLLGAGDDGRALRFGGGAVRWFEVDRPATQADKRSRLRALDIATTGTTYLGLDLLATTWAPRSTPPATMPPRRRCSSPRSCSTP